MRWMRTTLPLLFLVACDDLNKPMNHPASPKFMPESSSSSSSGSPADADAAPPSLGDAAAPAPAPSISAQPGDIQL